jgi:serine/threonine protein kinase
VLLNSKSPGVYDVRLTDFGYATTNDIGMQENKVRKILCGTPGYIPPEALIYRGYTPKSDIFSIGALIFYLLTRKNIF